MKNPQVGRLDYHSEGLLLLTTDGEFANRITSPAGHVEKVYVVKANGHLTEAQEDEFRSGISLHGKRTAPAKIKLIKGTKNPWYEVRLTEGRQNQIRIMFKHCGKLVEKLKRVPRYAASRSSWAARPYASARRWATTSRRSASSSPNCWPVRRKTTRPRSTRSRRSYGPAPTPIPIRAPTSSARRWRRTSSRAAAPRSSS